MYRFFLAVLILFSAFITKSSAQEIGSEIDELSWLIGNWQVTGKRIGDAAISARQLICTRDLGDSIIKCSVDAEEDGIAATLHYGYDRREDKFYYVGVIAFSQNAGTAVFEKGYIEKNNGMWQEYRERLGESHPVSWRFEYEVSNDEIKLRRYDKREGEPESMTLEATRIRIDAQTGNGK